MPSARRYALYAASTSLEPAIVDRADRDRDVAHFFGLAAFVVEKTLERVGDEIPVLHDAGKRCR